MHGEAVQEQGRMLAIIGDDVIDALECTRARAAPRRGRLMSTCLCGKVPMRPESG